MAPQAALWLLTPVSRQQKTMCWRQCWLIGMKGLDLNHRSRAATGPLPSVACAQTAIDVSLHTQFSPDRQRKVC